MNARLDFRAAHLNVWWSIKDKAWTGSGQVRVYRNSRLNYKEAEAASSLFSIVYAKLQFLQSKAWICVMTKIMDCANSWFACFAFQVQRDHHAKLYRSSLAKKTSEKIAFLLLQLWYTPLQLGHGGAETQETRKGNYQFPQKIYEMKVVLEGAISEGKGKVSNLECFFCMCQNSSTQKRVALELRIQ